MRAEGHSLRTIAGKLGIGYGTARKALGSAERKTPASGAAVVIDM
jgi:DNA-binding CsgD family transcriptional regulator